MRGKGRKSVQPYTQHRFYYTTNRSAQVSVCMHVCVYMCMHVYGHMYMYVPLCVWGDVCMYKCVKVCVGGGGGACEYMKCMCRSQHRCLAKLAQKEEECVG